MRDLCALLLKNRTRENLNEALKMIEEMGDLNLLDFLLLYNTELRESQKSLKYCCKKKDNLKMIEKMVDLGCRDWKRGMVESCKIGCKEAFDFLVPKAKSFLDLDDWEDLLQNALDSKSAVIVDRVIEMGAFNFKRGLQLKHPHKQMLFYELIIERKKMDDRLLIVHYVQCNLNKRIKYHFERKISDDAIQFSILKACEKGDEEIIEILLSMGISFDGDDSQDPLLILINKNRMHLANMIIRNSSHQLISIHFFWKFFFYLILINLN
jgi:hypothetical protein